MFGAIARDEPGDLDELHPSKWRVVFSHGCHTGGFSVVEEPGSFAASPEPPSPNRAVK